MKILERKERKERKGRTIVVNGVTWKYKVGAQNVIAYSENGERKCGDAATMKGMILQRENGNKRVTACLLPKI